MTQMQSASSQPSRDIASGVQGLMRRAVSHPGMRVDIPKDIATNLEVRLVLDATNVVEMRRRERPIPAELLALHVG